MRVRGPMMFMREYSFPDGSTFELRGSKDNAGVIESIAFADDEADAERKADAWLLLHPRGFVVVTRSFACAMRSLEEIPSNG